MSAEFTIRVVDSGSAPPQPGVAAGAGYTPPGPGPGYGMQVPSQYQDRGQARQTTTGTTPNSIRQRDDSDMLGRAMVFGARASRLASLADIPLSAVGLGTPISHVAGAMETAAGVYKNTKELIGSIGGIGEKRAESDDSRSARADAAKRHDSRAERTSASASDEARDSSERASSRPRRKADRSSDKANDIIDAELVESPYEIKTDVAGPSIMNVDGLPRSLPLYAGREIDTESLAQSQSNAIDDLLSTKSAVASPAGVPGVFDTVVADAVGSNVGDTSVAAGDATAVVSDVAASNREAARKSAEASLKAMDVSGAAKSSDVAGLVESVGQKADVVGDVWGSVGGAAGSAAITGLAMIGTTATVVAAAVAALGAAAYYATDALKSEAERLSDVDGGLAMAVSEAELEDELGQYDRDVARANDIGPQLSELVRESSALKRTVLDAAERVVTPIMGLLADILTPLIRDANFILKNSGLLLEGIALKLDSIGLGGAIREVKKAAEKYLNRDDELDMEGNDDPFFRAILAPLPKEPIFGAGAGGGPPVAHLPPIKLGNFAD